MPLRNLRAIWPLFLCWSLVAQGPTAVQTSTASTQSAANTFLTSALNAMGGSAGWQGVGGLAITGSVQSAKDSSTHSISSTLDWSTGVFRYSRISSGPSGSHLSKYDGTTPNLTKFANHSVAIPQMDPSAMLAEYSPALSILWVLTKPGYSVSMNSTKCPNGTTCIAVRKSVGKSLSSGVMEIQFSSSNRLPISTRRILPALSTRPVDRLETLAYGPMQNRNGYLFPSYVDRNADSPRPSRLTLQSIGINPAVSAQEFAGGAQ